MSDNCTGLYIHAIFYNIEDDIIFEYLMRVNSLDIDFHNEEFKHSNDIKKIKFKGVIGSKQQGNILLGCM
jgi:hypothetical protein